MLYVDRLVVLLMRLFLARSVALFAVGLVCKSLAQYSPSEEVNKVLKQTTAMAQKMRDGHVFAFGKSPLETIHKGSAEFLEDDDQLASVMRDVAEGLVKSTPQLEKYGGLEGLEQQIQLQKSSKGKGRKGKAPKVANLSDELSDNFKEFLAYVNDDKERVYLSACWFECIWTQNSGMQQIGTYEEQQIVEQFLRVFKDILCTAEENKYGRFRNFGTRPEIIVARHFASTLADALVKPNPLAYARGRPESLMINALFIPDPRRRRC